MRRVTGYTTRQVISSTRNHRVVTSLPAVKATAAASSGSDAVKLLITKPLFWTSVVSLFISVVATTVLVALCICRRHRPVVMVTRRRGSCRRFVYSTAPSDNQFPATADHNGMISLTASGDAKYIRGSAGSPHFRLSLRFALFEFQRQQWAVHMLYNAKFAHFEPRLYPI